jgi:hypothetical protein
MGAFLGLRPCSNDAAMKESPARAVIMIGVTFGYLALTTLETAAD